MIGLIDTTSINPEVLYTIDFGLLPTEFYLSEARLAPTLIGPEVFEGNFICIGTPSVGQDRVARDGLNQIRATCDPAILLKL